MCIRDRGKDCGPVRKRLWATHHAMAMSSTFRSCLLYTSDAADDLTRVDIGGRRIIQAEDGIRDLVRSRGLGDVYKRQGQGLRAGQKTALGDTPCHGDVFHIQKQCESLANVLARVAMGATSRRKALDVKMDAAKANSLSLIH